MSCLQIPYARRYGSRIARQTFHRRDLRAKDGSRAVIFAEVGERKLLDSRSDQPQITIEISGVVGRYHERLR